MSGISKTAVLLSLDHPQIKGIGDSKFIALIRHELYESLPFQQNAINQAILKQDWITLKSLTHRLLGTCVYCGAVGLQEVLQELQTMLHQQPIQITSIAVDHFNEVLEATLQALNQ